MHAEPLRVLAVAIGLTVSACADDSPAPKRPAAVVDAGARDAGSSMPVPPHVVSTDKLAVLAGPLYTKAPGQDDIGFYGTDLGVAFAYHAELRILFGDTWSDASGALIGPQWDDVQGTISLRAAPDGFPDGDAVDAFVAAQALPSGEPWWHRAAPPVALHVEAGKVAAFELHRADDGRAVDLGLGRAVMTAFGEGGDGAFAIFRRDVAVPCSGGADPSCDDGFACDTDLGVCSNDRTGEYARPCLVGGSRCGDGASCVPVDGGGFCQDRTSSLYLEGDEDGRLDAVVIRQEIGRADSAQPTHYVTWPFVTNKFTNVIAKVVADFDPERADPAGNDYTPADGTQPARAKVLLLGRPHTTGVGSAGRDSRLYFAYAEVPSSDAGTELAFAPRYFAGLRNGRPMYSDRQVDAVALDLGGTPLPESERFDIVDRTALTYLASMRLWVMFYGGDFSPFFLQLFAGPNFGRIARDPRGAIHARFAQHPWGPWTPPVPVLEAGDPSVSPPEAGAEYGPLGMLHDDGCTATDCIPGEPASVSHSLAPYGFLYGPNIFDPWTEVREQGKAVDVYWNVSSWSPYETVLLRTRLAR